MLVLNELAERTEVTAQVRSDKGLHEGSGR